MATGTRSKRTATSSAGANGSGGTAETIDQAVLLEVLVALEAMRSGDFSARLNPRRTGVAGDIARAFNDVIERKARLSREVTRLSRVVGQEGRLGERIAPAGAEGGWLVTIEQINGLVDKMASPTTEVARVLSAVAQGDLSQKMRLDIDGQPVKGEFRRIGTVVNSMVDQLSSFADEVTRVAREVGTDGQLGGQARVKGVSGIWKDLTDSVNVMASNLTDQVRSIAQVTTAVARGDLTQKIGVDARGEILELKETVNTMVDQLSSFADEVTRVAREVGTEGQLGGQARVKGVSGTWKDLTDNVNSMASNLTTQVRSIAQFSTAVARGDLTQKIAIEAKGEVAALADTLNSMTDTLRAFADEVTRVAREVGTEGQLGGQAQVPGVAGTWKDLTDSVNVMASNLTTQVRSIAQFSTAIARGDLSQKITVEARGEIAALADTLNSMTDTLRAFADEVTRVAREVGTEGELGGQAQVPGVAGTWKDLTDNVNSMASNLTDQVRNIAQVTTAVARGDLTQKITVSARGEILELKSTVNTMVDQLSSFADEVTRVAREVGTEGRLGGQAQVPAVSGTWKDLTDNVNSMASNLTDQVREIAQVTTAVAKGDLTQKITVDARGEVLRLKDTVNTMVDQLSSFADEVTRVAREVGTDGKLGGQADVPGVAGTWKQLTENVNQLATNLTTQVRGIAQVTTAVAKGDLTQKIGVDARGEILELKETVNTMVDQLSSFADEVTRVAREVGTEGELGGQARVKGVSGTWKDLTDNVNQLATNLTTQVRGIAQVTTAVARGDLSQKITVDARGEILELKETVNTMVDQLSSFADEVTRVAREVGTEGNLGGQAQVKGVSGTWRELTESVNSMADNLTDQVRNIAQVTTAVARGDLSQKITVSARGEILELKDTINTMVDQLGSFADEVNRVAREVGTEGRLGGQAEVEGVSGTWKQLTENVNLLAANLTNQVRAISEVSAAVTKGDLSRTISIDAAGELGELKDTINQMIENLAETTRANNDQDWLKTNVARITSMLQGQRDLRAVSQLIMSELTPLVGAQHGGFFMAEGDGDDVVLRLLASYGFTERKGVRNRWKLGEGLVGQAALERAPIVVTEAPGDYVRIASGLGEAAPTTIIVLPVLFEDQVLAVVELASLHHLTEVNRHFLEQIVETIGVVLATIVANSRTEELLAQSQRLAEELQAQSEELQSQQDELRRSNLELEEQARSLKASEELLQTQQEELQTTNAELEEKAAQLEEQNQAIEIKNAEIEEARRAIEEKAEQLALSSRYKSEFLANMSHELRTPLNSLLILARLLAENPDGRLDDKQVEYAQSIHAAGRDLLNLISDILDLSKVEAGKMEVHPEPVSLADVCADLTQTFQPLADQKGLAFSSTLADDAPATIETDEQRLQQVLKNLLSNAVKFTDSGAVELTIAPAPADVRYVHPALVAAEEVVEFAVTDTGIGIPADKRLQIFEAFQQADGTTSRRFGGTGLGLSISREIASLLGGEIHVDSAENEGSRFALYLPLAWAGGAKAVPDELPRSIEPEPAVEIETAADDIDDDRDDLDAGDRVLLVITSDRDFAATSTDLGHERGFKVLIGTRGDSGLALARQLRPDAIVLDTNLHGIDGIAVLEALKREPSTRHIPVHVVASEEQRQLVLTSGALALMVRPVTADALSAALGDIGAFLDRRVRRLLIVEDNERDRKAIMDLIGTDDDEIDIVEAASSEEALTVLDEHDVDCMVLDLKLPKMTGFDLLERVKEDPRHAGMPVVIYTGRDLTRREETRLKRYADAIIVKDARSPERLLDETSLFLHRVEARMPAAKRRMIQQLHSADAVFADRHVLVVDDDVRNVFALTSALESRGMRVSFAENGREGIEVLDANPDVDLVLMDIMMPELDGYETTRLIRAESRWGQLPIIALTAKAMKGDRERCIAAGASDYITKPVDIEQLLSLMRVWLYQ